MVPVIASGPQVCRKWQRAIASGRHYVALIYLYRHLRRRLRREGLAVHEAALLTRIHDHVA